MEYIKIDSEKLTKDIVSKAKMILNKGGVIALPTETVYGLVGGLFSSAAV